ncbi:alpha/beta hydrolase [Prescottella subtropica]|uniref:alpha/beta hydrolase n=1 Tax=Prescottella subtropica TaxID=2545757 RepID=UPI0010F998E9|nr:alpha/beta hydrolase family protein [Prescottella subtropica]
MRTHRPRFTDRWKKRLAGLGAAALLAPALAVAVTPATAQAAPWGGYEEVQVPSSMGPIKVQIQWAERGGNAALYLLDGMRARDDRNAWSFETNAFDQFRRDNLTLVLPVGGESSFYSDWYGPSNFNSQPYTYKWETFLTQELPAYLETRGVSRTNNAVAGLSMGGSAALTLAAWHRDQFKFAASYSGYLNLSAPGMREMIRIAMLDAGRYNVDAMWGPPWDPAWMRNDPFVNAEKLRGLSMYISSGSGLPGQYDTPGWFLGSLGSSDTGSMGSAGSAGLTTSFNTSTAMGLETISLANTRAFEMRLNSLGIPATYDFTPRGTHAWGYWSDQLWHSRGQILNTLNAW